MSKHPNHDDKSSEIAKALAPTGDFSVIWETKTVYVPFPIKILHGYRRYNIDYVVSPEADHKTVLAVHGFMHNALVFQPLGNQLLGSLSKKTSHFYSISLPGHGDMTIGSTHGVSGIPPGSLYGDMTLADYATALILAAKKLGRIDAIVAHSQGGIVVQLAEAMLKAAGSSFSSTTQNQTGRIVLLASTTPDQVSWGASDNDQLVPILMGFGASKSSPDKGAYLSLTDQDWHGLFYSHSGMLVPGAPDPTWVPHLKTDEPTAASINALGLYGQPRPSVPANIFGNYNFSNIAFQEDGFLTAADLDGLGNYLKPGAGHILVASLPGAPAIHCALYTKPELIVPYLSGGTHEI